MFPVAMVTKVAGVHRFRSGVDQSLSNENRHMEDDQTALTIKMHEINLCLLYGDHDECPYKEIDRDGDVLFCNCSCHLFPGAAPE